MPLLIPFALHRPSWLWVTIFFGIVLLVANQAVGFPSFPAVGFDGDDFDVEGRGPSVTGNRLPYVTFQAQSDESENKAYAGGLIRGFSGAAGVPGAAAKGVAALPGEAAVSGAAAEVPGAAVKGIAAMPGAAPNVGVPGAVAVSGVSMPSASVPTVSAVGMPGAPALKVWPAGFDIAKLPKIQQPTISAPGMTPQLSALSAPVGAVPGLPPVPPVAAGLAVATPAASLAPLFAILPAMTMLPLMMAISHFSLSGSLPSVPGIGKPNLMISQVLGPIGIGTLQLPMLGITSLSHIKMAIRRLSARLNFLSELPPFPVSSTRASRSLTAFRAYAEGRRKEHLLWTRYACIALQGHIFGVIASALSVPTDLGKLPGFPKFPGFPNWPGFPDLPGGLSTDKAAARGARKVLCALEDHALCSPPSVQDFRTSRSSSRVREQVRFSSFAFVTAKSLPIKELGAPALLLADMPDLPDLRKIFGKIPDITLPAINLKLPKIPHIPLPKLAFPTLPALPDLPKMPKLPKPPKIVEDVAVKVTGFAEVGLVLNNVLKSRTASSTMQALCCYACILQSLEVKTMKMARVAFIFIGKFLKLVDSAESAGKSLKPLVGPLAAVAGAGLLAAGLVALMSRLDLKDKELLRATRTELVKYWTIGLWSTPGGSLCVAPQHYEGVCPPAIDFSKFTGIMKAYFATDCRVEWPVKGQSGGAVSEAREKGGAVGEEPTPPLNGPIEKGKVVVSS
uniref:CPW-WPC domain-containing protein n=1 Tax=Chromera velia CCMP2878 TaxID=1169474 RepID=A0A0G4HS35_9ALVE|eukprot:Cvel_8233.t1-p1 / transcript=Cvel_8233.t1 / gene=Cvel_8233 / organism=Chromera_velia_CCMP2878 / gene_product=hypothetical protein / transcript_product=hypothetical protein / location=Cvel_scaffold450:1353-4937(-) / protein_length=734 / sequence_SO=supercontig / SO=protein_coding / is_pseudo=false